MRSRALPSARCKMGYTARRKGCSGKKPCAGDCPGDGHRRRPAPIRKGEERDGVAPTSGAFRRTHEANCICMGSPLSSWDAPWSPLLSGDSQQEGSIKLLEPAGSHRRSDRSRIARFGLGYGGNIQAEHTPAATSRLFFYDIDPVCLKDPLCEGWVHRLRRWDVCAPQGF